ncbi:hypothetical protein RJ55_07888 [Drechmeria coniospora]|nr:hypothetical protein RJ55_07888 [Drechmeria coniospora]
MTGADLSTISLADVEVAPDIPIRYEERILADCTLPLPRPQAVHQGWEPSSVSTAKCDMCHRQRCGTIQKCSVCKLSVCKECAFAARLHDDARHRLDPVSLDWDPEPLRSGRQRERMARRRPQRGTRGRHKLRDRVHARNCGSGPACGTQTQPVTPSAASSDIITLAPTVCLSTQSTLPSVDGGSAYDCIEPDLPAREEEGREGTRNQERRNGRSPSYTPSTEVHNVAKILAEMPNSDHGLVKRQRLADQYSPGNRTNSGLQPRENPHDGDPTLPNIRSSTDRIPGPSTLLAQKLVPHQRLSISRTFVEPQAEPACIHLPLRPVHANDSSRTKPRFPLTPWPCVNGHPRPARKGARK